MNELEIVRKLRSRAGAIAVPGLVEGIGDDCAVFRAKGAREDLVFTTDMLIEGVHFLQSTHPAQAVGHKALARGLSDIAAMGAAPRFCLVSLAVPQAINQKWVDAFYDGLLKLAARTGTALAGGDLSHTDKIVCDIIVCGAVPTGRALLRRTAKPGDVIYVSGRLGGSAAGLAKGTKKHLYPEPRLDVGALIAGKATACMDLSDGVSIDLHRLCEASGVAAALESVPIYRGATEEQALHGGEDYELLFTLKPRAKAPAGCFRIGRIVEGVPGAVTLRGGELRPMGYDHFRT